MECVFPRGWVGHMAAAVIFALIFWGMVLSDSRRFCAVAEDNPWQTSVSETVLPVAKTESTLVTVVTPAVLFAEAVAAVRKTPDARSRTYALIEIAAAQAEAGIKDPARQIFAEAVAAAQKIEKAEWRTQALNYISTEAAKAGLFAESLKIARGIEDVFHKAWAFNDLASAQAKAGLRDQARQTFAEAMVAAHGNAETRVVTAQIEAGFITEAIATTRKFDIPYVKVSILCRIVGEQAKAGQIEQARRICAEAIAAAAMIQDPNKKKSALPEIVAAQTKVGLFADALATVQQVDNAKEKAYGLCGIAAAQTKARQTEQALQTCDKAIDIARKMRVPQDDARPNVWTLCAVGSVQAKAGARDQASKTFHEALIAVRGVFGKYEKTSEIFCIAVAQAEAGLEKQADETFADAIAMAKTIHGESDEIRALSEIAEAQAKLGLSDQAHQTFTEALSLACKIDHPWTKAMSLRLIATTQAQVGFFAEAIATADGMKANDNNDKMDAFREIAVAQAKAGLSDQARQTYAKALVAARETGDRPLSQTKSPCTIVDLQLKAGLLAEAIATARAIKDPLARATPLCQIAAALAKESN